MDLNLRRFTWTHGTVEPGRRTDIRKIDDTLIRTEATTKLGEQMTVNLKTKDPWTDGGTRILKIQAADPERRLWKSFVLQCLKVANYTTKHRKETTSLIEEENPLK